ncbi:MAG TPA: winged helix DNA-binding protein [Blastocatellia bacterium]|jgi:predicted MarR family transcription regulator
MKRRGQIDHGRQAQPVAGEADGHEPGEKLRIISSAHLVSERSPELSEFEFGMIVAVNAFNRWVVRCMAAVGVKDITTLEALLLHHLHHRGRKKKLADICFMYNIEDTHVVSYSLKKLIKMGLAKSEKSGKEVLFTTTDKGARLIEQYRLVREGCLMNPLSDQLSEGKIGNSEIGEMARLLHKLTGLYDQAARAATSL